MARPYSEEDEYDTFYAHPTEEEYDRFYNPNYDPQVQNEPSPAEAAYHDSVVAFDAFRPQLQAVLGDRVVIHDPKPGTDDITAPSVTLAPVNNVDRSLIFMDLTPDKETVLAAWNEDAFNTEHVTTAQAADLLRVPSASMERAKTIAGHGLTRMAENFGTTSWPMPRYVPSPATTQSPLQVSPEETPSRDPAHAEAMQVDSNAKSRLRGAQGRESTDSQPAPDLGVGR